MSSQSYHSPGSSRVKWAVFIFLFGWIVFQFLSNTMRYTSVQGNMTTLATKINTDGPEKYKQALIREARTAGVDLKPAAIKVTANIKRSLYEISLPFTWTINFGVWVYRKPTVLEAKSRIWPESVWKGN